MFLAFYADTKLLNTYSIITVCFTNIIYLDSLINAELSPSKKMCFIGFNESPLKILKNAFYFIVKAPFVLKYLNFFLTFWSCRKDGLIRKIKLIQNLWCHSMVNKHRLPDISQGKDNQIMKLGQLVHYSKRKKKFFF